MKRFLPDILLLTVSAIVLYSTCCIYHCQTEEEIKEKTEACMGKDDIQSMLLSRAPAGIKTYREIKIYPAHKPKMCVEIGNTLDFIQPTRCYIQGEFLYIETYFRLDANEFREKLESMNFYIVEFNATSKLNEYCSIKVALDGIHKIEGFTPFSSKGRWTKIYK